MERCCWNFSGCNCTCFILGDNLSANNRCDWRLKVTWDVFVLRVVTEKVKVTVKNVWCGQAKGQYTAYETSGCVHADL